MTQLLVLGIGNRTMGDDGIGVRIVEALALENNLETVDFVAGETDVDFCLSKLLNADQCIIIDSGYLGKEPCSIGVFPLQQIYEQRRSMLSFHDFDLIHAMTTENLLKKGLLITIEICSIGYSTELSPLMEERFPRIIREIKEKIDDYKTSIISLP